MRAIDRLTAADRRILTNIWQSIERYGHYQGAQGQWNMACLVRKTDLGHLKTTDAAYQRIMHAICEAAQVVPTREPLRGYWAIETAFKWNDAVTTDEVLDVVAGLAVG